MPSIRAWGAWPSSEGALRMNRLQCGLAGIPQRHAQGLHRRRYQRRRLPDRRGDRGLHAQGPVREGSMLATPFRTAKELAADIRRKKIGCLELLELYLERVAKHNPSLNAIIAMDIDGARKRARAADRALSRKQPWGPLHGVPMTIKESYDVVGMPTTRGIPELKDNFPPRNALAVDRLLRSGVVLFGKTNVPIHLTDYQSYNAIYGVTNYPWDLSRSPGGSSGGSAAALAAGLTGLEAGSDIGSSIRNPAHYCGVYGHKPTWGVVPWAGPARPAGPARYLRDRSHGARRGGSRDRPGRHGGPGRDRRRRLQARPRSRSAENAA